MLISTETLPMDAMNEEMIAPDFLALGMGGTNMMSMLWTVAMGRQAVGVEMRGDPFLGVHWNIREDFYHQLGLIDQMMLERYGEAGVPRRGNGRIFRLAECFYSSQTAAGDIVADEIIDGYDIDQHIVGTIHHVEFIDDRWRDGLPNRVITVLEPPTPPDRLDPGKTRTSMVDVLDGPSTFQAEAASIQKLLRRYLELIEQQDLDNNREPRVRLFTHHRVVPAEGDGFIHCQDGRKRIRIEALQEFDFKGLFVRVRLPGSEVIDLGVPELFMIGQGFNSTDAKRLGFEQQDVKVDHGTGVDRWWRKRTSWLACSMCSSAAACDGASPQSSTRMARNTGCGRSLWAMRTIQRWVGFWFRFQTSKPSIQSSRDSFRQGLTQIRLSSSPPTNI